MTVLDAIKDYVMDGERIGDMSRDRLIEVLYELGKELGYYHSLHMRRVIELGQLELARERLERSMGLRRLN